MGNLSSEARECVERAFRTAALTIDISRTSEDITKYAGKELERVISGEANSFIDSLKDKDNAAVAITVAFAGVGKLVDAIHQGISTLKAKRKHMRDQMKLGSFVFIVPDDEDDLSNEQNFIHDFMDLVRGTAIDNLESLLGIRSLPPEKSGDPTAYCVLPFSDMDTGAMEETSNADALDSTRREMHARIRVTLPILRKKLLKSFKKGNWLTNGFWSFYEGDNYLNNYNQSLFMLMAISNLLWNLQHPMNAKTKKSLSPAECIALCKKLDGFLTAILAKNLAPRLKDKATAPWVDFISTARILVRDLQKGYEIARLKEFPIKPLSVHTRETVKMITIGLFELLYQDYDELSDKHRDDPKTAEGLAEILRDLRRYLGTNPNILEPFRKRISMLPDRLTNDFEGVGLHDILNQKPETLIDVLVVFAHLPRVERLAVRAELKVQENDAQENSGRFLRALEAFDEDYIRTLNRTLKKHPKAGYKGNAGRINRAHLIGQRLTPCLALLMDAFPIQVDIPESNLSDVDSESSEIFEVKTNESGSVTFSEEDIPKTAKEQINLISQLNRDWLEREGDIKLSKGKVGLANPKPYFYWEVSDLLDTKKSFGSKIDKFPPSIIEMVGVAELVEEVSEVVTRYEHVLQNKGFLKFLKNLIAEVRKAQMAFEQMCQSAEDAIARNETVSNQLKYILSAITEKLQMSLQASEMAAIGVTNVISDPKFAEGKRAEFIDKIKSIDQKYYAVFKKKINLERLFSRTGGCSYGRMDSYLSHSFSPNHSPLPPGTFHRSGVSSRRFSNSPPPLEIASSDSGEDWARELQQFSLIGLIEVCHDSMSYLSQWGHKGALLINLKKRVEKNENMTPADLRRYVLDLVRVTASARKTWFGLFQADYACAKSTQALIRAMKDKKVNLVLPLAEIVFGRAKLDLSTMSDEKIIEHLMHLRTSESWEFTEDEILEKNLKCLQL